MYTWSPIDLVNAVIIPILLLLTVGGILTVYFGYVTSRWLIFGQLIANPLVEQTNFPIRLLAEDDSRRGRILVHMMFSDVRLALVYEHQFAAGERLLKLARAEEILFNLSVAATVKTYGLSEYDLRDPETWRKVLMEYVKSSKSRAGSMVENIQAIRADLWAICGFPALGQWIRESNRSSATDRSIL